MTELNILNAPFKKFAIEAPWRFLNLMAEMAEIHYEPYENSVILYEYKMKDEVKDGLVRQTIGELHITGLDDRRRVIIPRRNVMDFINDNEAKEYGAELVTEMVSMALTLHHVLIVLLATKNHKADTTINRDLLAGRSNKKNAYRKDYPYTTTISVGKITESHVGDGDDPRTVRPHLRRGHIRTQRFGPDLSFEKKVFIEPVFVNASQGWIAKRSAYNVSTKAWSDSRANVC